MNAPHPPPESAVPLSMLYVYLTEKCNLACRHCWIQPVGSGDPQAGKWLSCEHFSAIVEQSLPLGLTAVKLTGGEPLLHPHFLNLLVKLREKGIRCVLETNGTLITPDIAAGLAAGPGPAVSVSLDGAFAPTHEWVRRMPGCYEAALAGIRVLVAYGVRPEIIMTVMRRNRHELEQMAQLAESLGVGAVKFNVLQPLARGQELFHTGEALTVPELVELGEWVERHLAPRIGMPLFFHHPGAFRPLGRIFSDQPLGCGTCSILSILGILADGSYSLCGIGQTIPALVFGHVSQLSLKAVWAGHPLLLELRRGLPHRLQGVCGECVMQQMCLGGCVAYNYSLHGSFWEPFWYCRQARETGRFPVSRLMKRRINTEAGQV